MRKGDFTGTQIDTINGDNADEKQLLKTIEKLESELTNDTLTDNHAKQNYLGILQEFLNIISVSDVNSEQNTYKLIVQNEVKRVNEEIVQEDQQIMIKIN